MREKWWAKTLRIIGIVLLSLASAFTLLGGIGTSCVAINPSGFGESFSGIAPYQWLWILFVLVGIMLGIMGIRSVVMLVRGTRNGYRAALVALFGSVILNFVHLIVSRHLRGSSMPVDGVLYMNILTLVIFLLFRLPFLWQGIDFTRPENGKKTGGQALAISLGVDGLLTLTIQFFMAPTHTINGVNYADVWHTIFTILGITFILAGIFVLLVTEYIPIYQKNRITRF